MKDVSMEVPKQEILELNINWTYATDMIGKLPTPITTVEFKIKLSADSWEKDRIMLGKHLVGNVEVYEVEKE